MANYFEAKKHAYRQTQDGIVISFTVHPNDMGAEIATAALGTRYMVAFCEIGDDETPIEKGSRPFLKPEITEIPQKTPLKGGENLSKEKPKRKFSELSLPEQAGIRCEDQQFQKFLSIRFVEFVASADSAAKMVRGVCGVKSRSELVTNRAAANEWRNLNIQFEAWQQDEKYADVRR